MAAGAEHGLGAGSIPLACPVADRLTDGWPGLEGVAEGHYGVADARRGYGRGPSYLGHLHSYVVAGLGGGPQHSSQQDVAAS